MNISTDKIIPVARLEQATFTEVSDSIEALIGEIRTLTEEELEIYSEMAQVSREQSCYESDDEYALAFEWLDGQLADVRCQLSLDAYTLAETIAHEREHRFAWERARLAEADRMIRQAFDPNEM